TSPEGLSGSEAVDAASHDGPLGDCTTWLDDGRFLISGYSAPVSGDQTDAERSISEMAEAGYTHVGPFYDPYPADEAAEAAAAGLCLIWQLGDPDGDRTDAIANQDRWIADVRAQLERVLQDEAISSRISVWTLLPEELDANTGAEAELLGRLGELIDDVDPLQRPVAMFSTSNADENELSAIVSDLDAVVQGQYLVNDGEEFNRAEIAYRTNRAAQFGNDGGGTFVLPVLEHGISDEDVDPADEVFIEAWVRHDIRTAIASGADGFISFSHAERGRPEIFGRYSAAFLEEVATLESAGLLAGSFDRTPLAVDVRSGPASEPVEEILSSGDRILDWDTATAAELTSAERSWIMLSNHTNEPLRVRVTGHGQEYIEVGGGRQLAAGSFEIDLLPFEAILGESSS
ncbi:MAG: hypothetical protein ACR2QO_06460, partial [Acidimicrobiales bacterium]